MVVLDIRIPKVKYSRCRNLMSISSKLLEMTLKELIENYPEVMPPVAYIGDHSRMSDVIELFTSRDIEVIVVVDSKGKPKGIIVDLDLLHLMKPTRKPTFSLASLRKIHYTYSPNLPAITVMERNPPAIHHSRKVKDMIKLMMLHHANYIVVVDDEGRAIGVVSSRNLTRRLLKLTQQTQLSEELM